MKKIESTRRDPAFNLAFEEYIARNTGSDEVLIVWRDSPAVVCGRFQNVFRETDVIAARERGVPVLRRITGGGTVYHDEGNVNVSYITRKGPDGIDTLLLPEKLAAALGRIGIPAEVGGGSDVTAGGYKISGSARAAVGDREIHHATLLFDTDLDALRSLTSSVSGDAFVSGGIASRKSPVANISAFLPGTSTDEFVVEVERLKGFPVTELAGAELARLERIVRVKIEPLVAAKADHIVLGCTHFPHLKPLIERIAGPSVVILDPSEAVARQARRVLAARGLLA